MNTTRHPPNRALLPVISSREIRAARGFSLIELMVALFIAGVLLLGLAAYFVTSSRNFAETERTSRQIENGRYAASLISEDIRHAGFYGEVGNVTGLPPGSIIVLPGALPNPCATAIATVAAALSLPIQGVDNVSAADPVAGCLPDYVSGTDVLVVRRSNTQTIAAGAAVGTGYYTQVAFCATAPVPIFKIAQSGFTLQDKDCATTMPVRQYHVYIYYIAACSIGTGTGGACAAGDPAIPTLKRAELATGGSITVSPLVEGIENLQIEYGLDTSATPDGSPDVYTANPTTVAQWAQVVAVRLHLLARNTDITPGFTDHKTYQLGLKADGTANNIVDPNDSYRRHAYTELVRVQNVSQRIEPVFGTPLPP
jgi:type IV pilus assembly protein PilW